MREPARLFQAWLGREAWMRKLASLVVMAVAVVVLGACGTASTAELQAIPADVNFGKVVLNAEAPKQLVAINNNEPYTATLEQPTFSGDPVFSVSTRFNTCDSGAHVSPYELCSVALTFRASQVGRYSGSISIPYHYEGGTATKVVTVTLRGSASKP